jgi:cytochrome P450
MGWDHNVALMRYGEGWLHRRKIAHQIFRKEAVKNYHNVLLEKVHSMLDGLLKNPEKFDQHNRMCATSSFPLSCLLIIDYHVAGYLSQSQ